MTKLVQITDAFAVAGALDRDDIERAAAQGFRTVINNRPDGEERGQLSANEAQSIARELGLAYVHIPATKHDIFTDEVVGRMAEALEQHAGPILAHCKSGQRSAIAWAAATARHAPVADVLNQLKSAGLDYGFLRDELDRQAHRKQWISPDVSRDTAPAARPAQSVRAA